MHQDIRWLEERPGAMAAAALADMASAEGTVEAGQWGQGQHLAINQIEIAGTGGMIDLQRWPRAVRWRIDKKARLPKPN